MLLETPRLILRPWQDQDRAPFAAINADAEVRRYYYPSILSPAETDELIDAEIDHLHRNGFGFLAVQRKADGVLIGGAGLSRPGPEVPGSHNTEIGWILGRAYWRQGYAAEVSAAIFDDAWARLGLTEIIGYTSKINAPSRQAMQKIGMIHVPDADFDDTTVPPGHVLRPHVLYRIENPRQPSV